MTETITLCLILSSTMTHSQKPIKQQQGGKIRGGERGHLRILMIPDMKPRRRRRGKGEEEEQELEMKLITHNLKSRIKTMTTIMQRQAVTTTRWGVLVCNKDKVCLVLEVTWSHFTKDIYNPVR